MYVYGEILPAKIFFVHSIFAACNFCGSSYCTYENLSPIEIWHHKLGDMVTEHKKKLCMRGYHVYPDIWEATHGNHSCTNATLLERELLNSHKRHALLKCTDGSLKESGSLQSARPSFWSKAPQQRLTVNVQIFVVTIFCGLNLRGD